MAAKKAAMHTKISSTKQSKTMVTPPVSPKKRAVIDYSQRESNDSQVFTPKVCFYLIHRRSFFAKADKCNSWGKLNKTESGILIITFADKRKKYTYMEDMEQKQFLKDSDMNFAKNFKVRDYSGKINDTMQTIGLTGKSSRFATCFVYIIPDEEEYNQNEGEYLNTLVGNLVEKMNNRVSERLMQYESITFKLPVSPLVVTMTNEPLPNFFCKDDCLQLFTFLYNKDIEEYSDTEQLFVDFPHITNEFLGSNTESNKKLLMKAHGENNM